MSREQAKSILIAKLEDCLRELDEMGHSLIAAHLDLAIARLKEVNDDEIGVGIMRANEAL